MAYNNNKKHYKSFYMPNGHIYILIDPSIITYSSNIVLLCEATLARKEEVELLLPPPPPPPANAAAAAAA